MNSEKNLVEGLVSGKYPGRGPEELATRFFFLLFFLFIVLTAYLLWDFLSDFLLAAILARFWQPFHLDFQRRFLPDREVLAGFLTTMLIVTLFILPMAWLGISLVQELQALFSKGPQLLRSLEGFLFGAHPVAIFFSRLSELFNVPYDIENFHLLLDKGFSQALNWLASHIERFFSNLFWGTLHLVLMILMLFYLLVEGAALKTWLFHLSPLPDEEEELLVQKFIDVGRAIILGNGLGSLLQGVLAGGAMAIAGLPSPIFWTAIMSLLAFLPIVGINIVVIPASIYLIVQGSYLTAIIFFVFCLAQSFFIENIVKTKLIGSHIRVHNMLIFLSLISGIALWGPLGLLYGPLIVVLFLAMADLYLEHYQYHFIRSRKERDLFI